MGALIYDSNGMLRFAGVDKAAALACSKLFALAGFTLVVRKLKRRGGSSNRLIAAGIKAVFSESKIHDIGAMSVFAEREKLKLSRSTTTHEFL